MKDPVKTILTVGLNRTRQYLMDNKPEAATIINEFTKELLEEFDESKQTTELSEVIYPQLKVGDYITTDPKFKKDSLLLSDDIDTIKDLYKVNMIANVDPNIIIATVIKHSTEGVKECRMNLYKQPINCLRLTDEAISRCQDILIKLNRY